MYYKGDHSLTFYSINEVESSVDNQEAAHRTAYNTWTHFHMIPTSRPVFAMPELKSTYVDIPGRDGSLDLTSKLGLPNLPRYGMRKGTWDFLVPATLSRWPNDYQALANAVHGLTKMVVCDDDPTYYYKGRITIDKWENGTDGNGNKVTLGYTLEPFKTALWELDSKQKWNPFCFATDFFIDNNLEHPYKAVNVPANKYVHFCFPSSTGYVVRDNPSILTTDFLPMTSTDLFSGVVQTEFKIAIHTTTQLTPINPGTVLIRLYNNDLNNHAMLNFVSHYVTTKTITRGGDVTIEDDRFIVSQRGLINRNLIQVKPSFPCDVTLKAIIRSL